MMVKRTGHWAESMIRLFLLLLCLAIRVLLTKWLAGAAQTALPHTDQMRFYLDLAKATTKSNLSSSFDPVHFPIISIIPIRMTSILEPS